MIRPGSLTHARILPSLLLIAIVASSLALNLTNIGFPLGYHYDEPKKVGFVQTSTQDFQHPILMLQIVRALNSRLRLTEAQAVGELGRIASAFEGACAVIAL